MKSRKVVAGKGCGGDHCKLLGKDKIKEDRSGKSEAA